MKTTLLLFFCLLGAAARAQVTGTVTDEKHVPLPGAAVKLMNGATSKTTLTDIDGKFSYSQPVTAVVISYIGFVTDTIKTIKSDLGIINMLPDSKALGEVVIKSRQPVIRQAADRTVITVNAQVLKLADNALDIVNLAPGLSVSDNEDAILMSGKSEVQVMINDKVVKMTPRDLAKYLKSLPSGSVKEVEIMANPSAKYEVNGQTGIVNIKTNSALKGLTGSVDGRTSQSTYNWTDISGILNYGSERFAVSGYGAWHTGGYLTEDLKNRRISQGNLVQQQEQLDKWSDPIFRITVDYLLSKNSTIGGLIEQEASTNKGSYNTHSLIDHISGPDTSYNTAALIPNVRHWKNYNLNYRYGDALTVDLDRVTYAIDDHTQILNTGFPSVDYRTLTNIDINTLKSDYSHTFKSKLKLEGGIKLSDVQTHNNFNNDRFFYREKIGALYAGLSRDYGKWGWQAGLRAENSDTKGIANPSAGGEIIRPDSSYLNLLPSFYLTWSPDSKNNLRLSLSRRIRRPDYGDLAPFTYQIDPLNYRSGNSALRAQRTDNAELSYTFDDRISLVSSYSHTADYFSPVIRQSGQILFQMTGNAGSMTTWNFDLNYPIKVSKWWSMLNKLNVANDHFRGQLFQGNIDLGNWHYQISSAHTFTLPGKYTFQVSGRFTSAQQQLIYYQQNSANVNMSIGKKFMANQASVRLGVSDVFRMQRNNTIVDFGNLHYTDFGTFESRRFSLTFSWRFGNQKIRQTEDRERSDADEKSRSGK